MHLLCLALEGCCRRQGLSQGRAPLWLPASVVPRCTPGFGSPFLPQSPLPPELSSHLFASQGPGGTGQSAGLQKGRVCLTVQLAAHLVGGGGGACWFSRLWMFPLAALVLPLNSPCSTNGKRPRWKNMLEARCDLAEDLGSPPTPYTHTLLSPRPHSRAGNWEKMPGLGSLRLPSCPLLS